MVRLALPTSYLKGASIDLQVLQDQTPLGRYVSAPLFALVLGFALAAAGVLPVQSAAYDIVWEWLMPLATALYLLDSADLRQYVLSASMTAFPKAKFTLNMLAGTANRLPRTCSCLPAGYSARQEQHSQLLRSLQLALCWGLL